MTPQEEQLLQSLVQRVNSTQLNEKDPDAEAFLNQSFSSNPDAIYILAQTVLVQNIALDQAKAQVAQLQQQAQQPARSTSFLGNLLGHRDPQQPQPQPAPVQTGYPQAGHDQAPPFQPVQQYAQPVYQPQYQPAQPQFAPMPAGQPSFFRGAMQTAAGVAAGALAFEGVEAALHGIMGHPGYGWGGPGFGVDGFGMGGPGMGVGFERPAEEMVINNYYDQPGGALEHHEQHFDQGSFDQGGFDRGASEQHSHESADQGSAQFTDASYSTQGDDRGGFDNSNFDNSDPGLEQDDNSGFADSSYQDSGGFDDGGGFDGGGDSSFV